MIAIIYAFFSLLLFVKVSLILASAGLMLLMFANVAVCTGQLICHVMLKHFIFAKLRTFSASLMPFSAVEYAAEVNLSLLNNFAATVKKMSKKCVATGQNIF